MVREILFALLIILIGTGVVLIVIQHRMIFFPRQYTRVERTMMAETTSEITWQTAGGSQSAFYFSKMENRKLLPDELWVVFGGNAMVALDWIDFVKTFPDRKTGFLLIDYPGYGNSCGRATPASILVNAENAFALLADFFEVEQRKLEKRLNVLGQSLGTGAALEFSLRYPPKRLILLSPFTSMKAMAKRVVGPILSPFLIYQFNNKKNLKQLHKIRPEVKVSIFHGNRDQIVPFEMGEKLYKKHPAWVSFHEVKRCDHNQIREVSEDLIFKTMLQSY